DARHAAAGPEMLQWLAEGQSKARSGRVVVGQQRLLRVGDVRTDALRDGVRLRWVVVRFAREDLNPQRSRAVPQVRFIETEADVALQVADVGSRGQRLAQA